jgi:hypothetical protein
VQYPVKFAIIISIYGDVITTLKQKEEIRGFIDSEIFKPKKSSFHFVID